MDKQHNSGTGQWQRSDDCVQLRAPRSQVPGLSADAAVFVPKSLQFGSQPAPLNQFRGENSGIGGAGGGGGGGDGQFGHNQMIPSMMAQYSHDTSGMSSLNGLPAMMNGAGPAEVLAKPSALTDRLKNLQISGPPQAAMGHQSYADNKDIRNSSHYNHHQQHPNQHFSQHSQQQRLQQQHHHQQQHLPLHQNAAGGHFPFPIAAGMGYSPTAINNHLHHPILGGMSAVTGGPPGMMGGGGGPHDNRNKNQNSAIRARLHNAQNSHGGMQHGIDQPEQQHRNHHQNHYNRHSNQHHNSQHHHNHHHRSQQQHHQSHHHQQQQQHHHYQSSGPSQHGMGGRSMGDDFGADCDADQASENETIALDYLTEVIAELYDNPGMFENIQRKLKSTFHEFRNNQFVLSNAVEMIFEQSIKEQNFRYMGARLCHLLDSIKGADNCALRDLLSMKMEHQQNELPGYMQNEQIKVRGTTLFLAELYMQLRKPSDPSRNNEIGMRIIGAANILLHKEGPENIKCVCQSLKLCGYELERDCHEELMTVLSTLGQLENSTDCSTGRFIRSVLDLQQSNWGRSEEVEPISNSSALSENACDTFNDSPVFYGPDGEVMTEEENDFLDKAAPVAFEEFESDTEDQDDFIYDENMTAEDKQAFKDFMSNQDKSY
ncbi:uncharacterized protein LOC129760711 [Uranotaenia lowii]|uniref:uncharacterized protein LOC129760711 n=1 Tax=Uranotaenia lowii TaxID=190385 RepID=UPI0024790527|nr:uncharacterized protein LOC129760711 [Uranotaenia lowii]XP_055614346.1 uncharacterized protein LOC129760711 [Uranotaenia lowii]XP_055614347.1 uncharacterized protein LOC129760711 [Uranotaenia lowii]